jgi:hypothetical protein
MNVSALAELCVIDQPAITTILNKIRDSDYIMNDLEDCLKPYAGKELRLITNDPRIGLIIIDEVCQAILEYYVFDARTYKGKEAAKVNFRNLSKTTIRLFIWSKTGYQPDNFTSSVSIKDELYWYKRLKIATSDSEKPLPPGYFCIYLEMIRFFAELENRLGYIFPDKNQKTGEYIVVDISIGQRFNSWLRSDDEVAYLTRKEFLGSGESIDFRVPSNKIPEGGKNLHEVDWYNHVYPFESHGEYAKQSAKAYPNKYRGLFNHFLEEYYIPDFCFNYIKDRDPIGIEEMKQNVLAMSDFSRASLSNTLVGRFITNLLPPSK